MLASLQIALNCITTLIQGWVEVIILVFLIAWDCLALIKNSHTDYEAVMIFNITCQLFKQ